VVGNRTGTYQPPPPRPALAMPARTGN